MKKIFSLGLLVVLVPLSIFYYFTVTKSPNKGNFTTDFARIESAIIDSQVHIQKIDEIKKAIKQAKEKNIKVSIAWKKYSWWWHTITPYGMMIDMSQFNNILEYNPEKKYIRVESWITWWEIQNYIHEDNLALWVTQSSNVFSVWWSVSSNIHGRDPRFSTIVDSIISMRLVDAQGKIIEISREKNQELFSLVIWGFGLFWVISDVTLKLEENENYVRTTEKIDYKEYSKYLEKNIINNDEVWLHYWRLDFWKWEWFLEEFFVTNYHVNDTIENKVEKNLLPEKNILRNRFFFNLSREFNWAKKLRWELQKSFTDNPDTESFISRNNAMNPPIKFISYYDENTTDILQEFFIPLDNFSDFIDDLREILKENKVNLLSVTTRYVPKNSEVFLAYNSDDMVAIVLYFSVWLSDQEQSKVKKYIQEIIESSSKYKWRYYLTYQNYADKATLSKIYPEFEQFLEKKLQYDPWELFSNMFYEKYSD